MRNVLRNIIALAAVLGLSVPQVALATSRVNWYAQQNPISTWLNLGQRDVRIGEGAFAWNAFGSNAGFAGKFSNLSIATAGSLNVQVGPTNTSFPGTLYAIAADDTAAYPATQPSGATGLSLTADSTQLLLEGIATTATGSIGTTAGSSSGQSVDNLIECKPLTQDQTTQTINLITSSGGSGGTASINRDRADVISCQAKASASSTTPVVPSVDAGYVALGYVNVPQGTSTVTSGMITNYTPFQGFALANQVGATALDTSSTAQTKTGSLTDSSNINAAGNLSFGGSSVGGTFFGATGNANISGTSTAGQGFTSLAGDAAPQLLYVSNNGTNQTSIGQNSGSGYPYFSVGKLSNVGGFQSWLLGIDASSSLQVPSGNIITPNNMVFGSGGTGGTLSGSTGNANISGGYYAGTAGIATTGGALTYGTNSSGVTTATIGSNNSSCPQGVCSSLFGLFAQPAGTNELSVDTSGNTAINGNGKIGGSLSVTGGTTTNGFINSGPATITGNASVAGITDSGGATFGSNISTNGISNTGPLNSTGNISWGNVSTGGTLYAATGNVNASGALNMNGSGFFGGSLTVTSGLTVSSGNAVISNLSSDGVVQATSGGVLSTIIPGASGNVLSSNGSEWTSSSNVNAPGSVSAQNGFLSTSQGANSGTVFFGLSGIPKIDYGQTVSGKYTLNELTTAGVVVNNSSGTLSSVAPGASGNMLLSNGSEWTSATLSHSALQNGYTTLPGGIIMEWGVTASYSSEGGKTVTLPLPFPNGILNQSATLYTNSPNINIDQSCQVYPISTSQIGVYMQQNGGGLNTYPQFCSWQAIGY